MKTEVNTTATSGHIWEDLLAQMIAASQITARDRARIPLTLLAVAHVAQRHGLLPDGHFENDIANIKERVSIVEKYALWNDRPLTNHLLSGIDSIGRQTLKVWLQIVDYATSLPQETFPAWFNHRLDDLNLGNQHDTPPSVIKLIEELISYRAYSKVIDPHCGTGGLLAAALNISAKNPQLFGLDSNIRARALAKLRFLVMEIEKDKLTLDDWPQLTHPESKKTEEKFDLVVCNPPFGMQIETAQAWENFSPALRKFPGRIYSESAFILHITDSMATNGNAAIIVPIGFLSRTGFDQFIRKEIVERDMLQTVVSLPEKLFSPETNIPTALLFLNKGKPENQKGRVLFIDASSKGTRDGVRAILTDQVIGRIQKISRNWDMDDDIGAVISNDAIRSREYLLQPSQYVLNREGTPIMPWAERKIRIAKLDREYQDSRSEFDEIATRLRNFLNSNS